MNNSVFSSQQSAYTNQTPYYQTPLSMLRVLLYGSLFHSGITTGPPTLCAVFRFYVFGEIRLMPWNRLHERL